MENSLITSIAAVLFGGGALALFWKPLSAVIASAVTNNRAGGEVITHYKEQVVLLKAANDEPASREQRIERAKRKGSTAYFPSGKRHPHHQKLASHTDSNDSDRRR